MCNHERTGTCRQFSFVVGAALYIGGSNNKQKPYCGQKGNHLPIWEVFVESISYLAVKYEVFPNSFVFLQKSSIFADALRLKNVKNEAI